MEKQRGMRFAEGSLSQMTKARALAITIVSSAALLSGCPAESMQSRKEAAPVEHPMRADQLFIENATIVDVRKGLLLPGMNIAISRGQITTIAPRGSLAADSSAQIVDATGKFVVPGYNDMHVHVMGEDDLADSLALMLANGITGFRQMSGSEALLEQRRKGGLPIRNDEPALLAMPGPILTPVNARTPEMASALVRKQQAAGADFIKIGLVSPIVLKAALEESHRDGIPALGHVPPDVDAITASNEGMHSIEHLGPGDSVMIACSMESAALQGEAPALPAFLKIPFAIPFSDQIVAHFLKRILVNPSMGLSSKDFDRIRLAVSTYSEAKCHSTAAVFTTNKTWQVPTLIRLKNSHLADSAEFTNDLNLKYVDADRLNLWREVTKEFIEKVSPKDKQILRDAYSLDLKLVKLLDADGVRMMAGSDAGPGWIGFSLHTEFDELATAGLSPLHILQMTTINAAGFLGRTSTMGTVEQGKVADLVVLDANPLDDAGNLHRINAVIRSGFYRSSTDLANLKAGVAASVSR
ncbi:MAG: hypothetical protein JWQ90_2454 [Hydrocarboniphaga sp.]|uniref:amidohydrolase family protein n=1 Tax=Hydrocarboniphaga sp. TaxID=2033016 RepID=UPI00261565BC|nr:amidohydrolase family protein [Hydrocarboniphaga sp.]MDB5970004.1 hypothetical protein [Hydrocarboniphaga sp.]